MTNYNSNPQRGRRSSVQRPGISPRIVIVRVASDEVNHGERHTRLAALLSDAITRRFTQIELGVTSLD